MPGLAGCCLWFRTRSSFKQEFNQRGLNAFLGLVGTCALVFAYRFWVIGGIGGYRDLAGSPTILRISVSRIGELLFFRLWAVLLFPVNWSVAAQSWLIGALLIFVIGATWSGYASRPHLNMVLSSVVFIMLAILPASHLALLNSQITGSRVYHLAVVGSAMLIGSIYDGFENARAGTIAITCVLAFQCAALIHNEIIWRDVAQLAKETCAGFGQKADVFEQPAVVRNLPMTHNGVYFLFNGFSDCVEINSGVRLSLLDPSDADAHPRTSFIWSEASSSIQRQR